MTKSFYLTSTIEVKTYNQRERKDTYNVIGIMKGEVEPGITSLSLHTDIIKTSVIF
jgi:hypothetical protein